MAPLKSDLLDDLAYQIHDYLLEESFTFKDDRLVFVPIAELVKKFQKNHRTISRRLTALGSARLIGPVLRRTSGTLYWVTEEDEDS